jgi:hypothetical protein
VPLIFPFVFSLDPKFVRLVFSIGVTYAVDFGQVLQIFISVTGPHRCSSFSHSLVFGPATRTLVRIDFFLHGRLCCSVSGAVPWVSIPSVVRWPNLLACDFAAGIQ